MEPGWDKTTVRRLTDRGIPHIHVREFLGELSEQRQQADTEGYNRGFNDGFAVAVRSLDPDKMQQVITALELVDTDLAQWMKTTHQRLTKMKNQS